MGRPRIIPARTIGLKFRANKSPMGREETVVGHYSGANTTRARNLREGLDRARSFHRHHLSQGWAGIGYHYMLVDTGEILCCRPVIFKGSHVLSDNQGRVGINMPGNGPDRPTKRQAMSLHWLLHNAHTAPLTRPHRTTTDLSRLPIFGHRELMSTACPGLFLGMYKRRGDPWREVDPELESFEEEFAELTDEDEEIPETEETADSKYTGPDEDEAQADVDPDDEGELPEADDEFEDDLSEEELQEVAQPER